MAFFQQSQQQQLEDMQTYNREGEYLSAQRAAAEALMVGRETLEVAERQGEQLRNAENMADETEYKLDRATRILRGMTWSGWLANKFTRDVEPPTPGSHASMLEHHPASLGAANKQHRYVPTVYENVPDGCQDAAQAVQNYHCNVLVLDACETNDQRDTCVVICNNMYNAASKHVTALHQREFESRSCTTKERAKLLEDFAAKLVTDLETLRERQEDSQKHKRGITPSPSSASPPACRSPQGGIGMGGIPAKSPATLFTPSPLSEENQLIAQQQEEHLDTMARHLSELGSIAGNLNISLGDQHRTLDSLEFKTESTLFKSKMVTRRADRLVQKNSWTRPKAELEGLFSIQHISTGKYLAVDSSNSVVLSFKFNETCLFNVWKHQSGIFGIQNRYSRKWVGQNLLGNLSCSATSFNRREEWDTDGDWSKTALLCTSAGWGNGGYVLVRPNGTVAIGGRGLQDKKIADMWKIELREPPKAEE